MRFLIDAQLPRQLVRQLREQGIDAIHTLDLPSGNRTSDAEICAIAESEERIVVTKDADFVHSYILHRRPPRLLLISTGNISNTELAALVIPALPMIVTAFESASFIELNRIGLITHS